MRLLKQYHPTQFCIRCDQLMTWQGLQYVEVEGERRALNIYHCDLCDKLSAATLPRREKRRSADALPRR